MSAPRIMNEPRFMGRNNLLRILPVAVVATALAFVCLSFRGMTAYAASTSEIEPLKTDSLSIVALDSVVADSLSVDSLTASAPARKGLGDLGSNISSVENNDNKPPQPILHYYDKHGNPLKEPVLFLAELDTVTQVKSGPVYPLLNAVSIGANFFDGVMLVCGQKHAGFDLWADLSLHNWFFPVLEMGVGYADNKPEEGNFHYKSKPSLYTKIGLNYNFLYKSDPAYQVFLGLRAGFSHFSYDITGITVTSPYWQQSQGFDILNQKASVFYGEALAGIKVKIWKNLSMGWNLRVHFKMHSSTPANSVPWYVPGYGTNGLLGVSFSLIYTLPFHHSHPEEP